MKGSTGSNAAPPLARAQPRGLPSGRDPMRGMGIGGARLRRAAAGVLALLLAVPALAADWYAAPGGSGSLCSQASPCTIQGAIDAAAPYDTVHVAAGDYAFTSNRIVIETEGLRLVGDNSPFAKPYATPPGPGQIAHGTADNKAANASVLKAASAAAAGGGTSAMVWVRNVPNVRIEKLYIEVNSSAPFLGSPRAKEGIAATGNVNGLELVDNYIKITSGTAAIGLGLNLSAGSNSSVPAAEPRGNGDFVTVDGNVVEPTSSASAAPKYAIGLQNSTGVFVRNQVAGHTMDMSLKPVAKGANPLAQRVFKVEENWTFGRLGLYVAGGYSLAEPARIANNHFVMSQEYGDDADTHLVSLKGISAPGTIVEGNVFTGFRKNYSGLWVQSRPNVTIQGNTFQPLAGQSDFRAIVVGNWSLQTGVPPSPATFDVTIRGNTFLANGATSINKGKAILFVDDNDASGAATFTKAVVGGSQLADANSFDSGIGWYIALDDRTCTGRNHASTSGGCNGGAGYPIGQGINYTSGTDGSSISQKRPFKWDVQAAGNSFGGVYMPSMGLAQFNAVWAKTYDKHNAGDTTVGNVLYGYPPITSGTITFTPTAFAYDGNAHPISATLAEDPDATCIVTPATITNAGTHAVAADCVSSTYHVTGSDSVVVSKAAGSVVWGTLNFTYDGSSPTVTATLAEETGVSCTVTGTVGPNAGNYPVSASCNGSNHTASGNATATIAKATGTVTWGTLAFTYDGSSPTVTATLAEETGVACTVTGAVGPNAGSYPVSASCNGSNHTASGNATATIAKATGTVTWGTLAFTYDGSSPTVTATLAEETGVACTVTGTVGPNAGSYPISASCNGSNHTASGNATATIAKATGTVAWGTLAFTYDGGSPTVTATLAEETGVSCAVTGAVGPNAGSYPVSASCNGSNHTASGNATATIAKAAGTVAWGTLAFTYDGSSPTVTATLAEETGVTCAVTGAVGPNAGSYPVIASCNGSNHTASGNATATIAKATGTVAWGTLAFTYDGSSPTVTATLAEETGVSCTVTGAVGPNAGSYPVSASCNGSNHTASGNATATIAKATGTVAWGTLAFTYDGSSPTVTATLAEETGVSCTVTGAVGPNAGSYPVSASCNGSNHTASGNATATIAKATGTVSFGPTNFTFDGTAHSTTVELAQEPAVTCALTPTGDYPRLHAGSTTLAATCTGTNYEASGSTTLVVAAKGVSLALTGLGTFPYDGNPHPAGVTVTGEVTGFPAVVDITYDGGATPPVGVGSHAVAAELAASATDYSASPVSGLIVIEVAQATVTLGDLSAVYDGDPHAASVSTEPTGLTVSVTYDGVNDVPVDAGSYAIVATVTQQGYSGSASGTLVIAKAEATVAITDTTQAWDGNPKPVTVTTTPANLAVAVTYDGDGTPPSAVGSYAVVATITDANHSGSANATLTITAGAASGIAANGATTFSGVAGQPLTGALPAVKVTDAGGHPVAGVAVTFTAGANSGTLTGASQTTDSSGIATLGGWTLDATPGTNTVVASAAGVTGTVAFTATGVSVLDGFNVSISDGRNATQVGRLLTYTITVGNAGSFGANGVHVTDMLPDELDVAGAQWQCSASNGASCTASGSGDLDDTIDLPAGGSVVYLLTAQVVADIDGMIDNGVTVAAGGNSIVRTDSTEIVIFRDGFELGGDGSDWDEAIEPVAAGSLSETQELTLDVAGLAPLQRVTLAQAADCTFAVEAIRIGETVLVRLVAGRQATAWSALDGERFALVLVGTRLGLVGAQADLVVELAQGGSLAVERLMHH